MDFGFPFFYGDDWGESRNGEDLADESLFPSLRGVALIGSEEEIALLGDLQSAQERARATELQIDAVAGFFFVGFGDALDGF